MMNDFITPLIRLPGEVEVVEKTKTKTIPNTEQPILYKDSKLPFITNIYVASLTFVGLFIVFRFVQKCR